MDTFMYNGANKKEVSKNGKVERSHRTDEEEFYRKYQFSNGREIEDRIAEWEKEYNFDRPHMALKGLTPAEKLHKMVSGKSNVNCVQKNTL